MVEVAGMRSLPVEEGCILHWAVRGRLLPVRGYCFSVCCWPLLSEFVKFCTSEGVLEAARESSIWSASVD